MTAHHEVWWADAGPSLGRRPVLVLHRDPVAGVIENVVVAPLTTTDRGVSSHLRLGPEDGMPRASWVNFDAVATIRRSWLIRRITVLSPSRSREACDTLAYALGCRLAPEIG